MAEDIYYTDGVLSYWFNSANNSLVVDSLINENITDLEIPSSCNGYNVISIKENVFRDNLNLQSVKLPDTMYVIAGYAFYNCNNLSTIEMGKNIHTIGSYAFYNCTSLEEILIGTDNGNIPPDSNPGIHDQAFMGCTSLSKVFIGNNIAKIGADAFRGCTNLNTVTLCKSVTTIGVNAFFNSENIQNVYYKGTDADKNKITINNGNTSLQDAEWYNIELVTQGYLTYEIVPIDSNSNSVTLLSCDKAAQGEIEIATEINNTIVTSISDYAFFECSNTINIIIPSTIIDISRTAFWYAFGLTGISVSENNEYYSSIDGVLFDKSHTELIQYPIARGDTTYTIPNSVSSLRPYSFCHCGEYVTGDKLIELVIPDSVTNIGDHTFSYFKVLEKIHIGNSVESIGECAFECCSNLKNINLPDSVKNIGESTFSGCNLLQYVTLSDNITIIPQTAFGWCVSLVSIVIPNKVTEIHGQAFRYCINLNSVVIPNTVNNIGLNIPSYNYNQTFRNCNNLTDVYFIGTETEWETININTSDTWLENATKHFNYELPPFDYIIVDNKINITKYIGDGTVVDIPHNIQNLPVVNIGDESFKNCINLTSVTIPDSVTHIGESVFNGCYNIENITLPFVGSSRNANHTYDAVFGYIFGYSSSSEDNTTAQEYSNAKVYYYYIPSNLKTVIITDTTQIPYGAFNSCSNITNIYLPNKVTTICMKSFYYCTNLKSVDIGNNVIIINAGAFSHCTNLESINIPDTVTDIGIEAFGYCSSLQNVTIPDSVKTLGHAAFTRCSALNNIQIGNGVTYFGPSCFNYCEALTDVILTDGLSILGDSMFDSCTSLLKIVIPSSVTSIPSDTFYNCNKLQSITFSKNIKTIGRDAFRNCNSLESIYYRGTKTQKQQVNINNTAECNVALYNAKWYYSLNGKIRLNNKLDDLLYVGVVTTDINGNKSLKFCNDLVIK